MPTPWILLAAIAAGAAISCAVAPVAIRVAHHFEFYDHPIGYKGHERPTPYLGGTAVILAFVVAGVVLAGRPERTLPLLGAVLVLWLLGTIDDRRTVSPGVRVAAEAGLGVLLWAQGLHWHLGAGPVVDILVSVAWVVAVTNAFNLFDNMDGAAGTIAGVTAGTIALFGAVRGNTWLAASSGALCGACVGFLPWNLSRPARLFLGDGGSMPVGFAIASLVMIGLSDATTTRQALAMGLLFVGIPALDTALVVVSRTRRGIPLLTGGRDHLTHRAHRRLRTTRAVAASLGAAQAVLASLAMVTLGGSPVAVLVLVSAYLVLAIAVIAVLDTDYARGEATAEDATPGRPRLIRRFRPPLSRRMLRPAGAGLAGLVIGISQFASGMYDVSWWGPAGVAMFGILTALVIVRVPRLTGPRLVAVGGLLALGGWTLLSTVWGPSPDSASLYGDRVLLYAAALGALIVLVETRRAAEWALAGLTAGIAVVAVWTVARMLLGHSAELFYRGRLDGAVGYINGQSAAFLLALIPCLMLAGRGGRWRTVLGGAGVALFGGLVFLSQSRGTALAGAAALCVLLVAAPDGLRRLRTLVAAGACLAAAYPVLSDVWTNGAGEVSAPLGRHAAWALLAATAGGGLLALALRAFGRPGGGRRRSVGLAVLLAAVVIGGQALVAGTSTPAQASPGGAPVAAAAPSSRFGQLSGGDNRPEYWSIALDVFARHPLIGGGGGSFATAWYRDRPSQENVDQPHSLGLQTLAEGGLIGGLLLAAVLLAPCVAVLRARPWRLPTADRLLAAGAAAMFVAWLVQAMIDWTFLLPSVTGAWLVSVAIMLVPRGARAAPRRWSPWTKLALAAAAGVVMVASVTSISRRFLAEHYASQAAQKLAGGQVGPALASADQALHVDGDLVSARWTRAAALARRGDAAGSLATLRAALRTEPQNFTTWALVGDRLTSIGDRAGAHRAYVHALRLNPREPVLAALARRS